MNNNDASANNMDNELAEQEANEQLVWERLQNEALAAQRWRLEQEMEQAHAAAETGSGGRWFEAMSLSNRLMLVALVSFVVGGLVVAVFSVW